MGLLRLLKPGLFTYECIRILLLASYVVVQSANPVFSLSIVFAAPGAIFPLMALFLWLDISRYSVYLPLFAAGKSISIVLLAGYTVASGRFSTFELLFLSGDILALAAIILLLNNIRKLTEVPVLTETAGEPCMEEN